MPRFAKTQGIVLRKHDFSETSQVVSVFTRDFGRVRLLAKGSRSMRRKRVPGFLDHLVRIELVFIPKHDDTLSTLTEFEILDDHGVIRCDLDRLGAAWLAVELLDLAAQDFAPAPEIYDLSCALLAHLASTPHHSLASVLLAFEVRLLRRLGFGLELEHCLVNGTRASGCRELLISPALGGLIDGANRAADPSALPVSRGVVAALSGLGRGSFEAAARTRLPDPLATEARRLLVRVFQHVFERRVRTAKWMETAALDRRKKEPPGSVPPVPPVPPAPPVRPVRPSSG